jgi:shikimate 5-dehydrogenase
MPKRNALLILGAGGHGKSVAEAALLSGKWKSIVFVDDCWPHKKKLQAFR